MPSEFLSYVPRDQESMRLHKLRYKESLSKKIFLELLRDNAKVTHEDNERIRK
jgi:hypothetical protein